jgi:hypothetical protein
VPKIDMSAAAVTTRLKRVSQLRRLGLSLQKARIKVGENRAEGRARGNGPQSEPPQRKS